LRAARRNDPAPRLVINGVGLPKRPEIAPADFARAVEAEPSALLAFDARLFGAAANNGQMIAEMEDGAKTAEVFNELALLVTGRSGVRRESRKFLETLRAVFRN
jgi:pilus assembly protein CpaE